jgi:CBS domain-containing protein
VRVQQIMTSELVWVQGDVTVLEATELMRTHEISSILVDRRDPDDTWGIVTLSDVVNKVVETGKDPRKVRVHEITTKPLILVGADFRVEHCAQLMERTQVRRLPVFDGENIIGIVAHSDIVRALLYQHR